MFLHRYELQSSHAGVPWLVIAIYADSDAEAIDNVAAVAQQAIEGGAVDLALFEIGLGTERLIQRYEVTR